jgi:hypothetical protein
MHGSFMEIKNKVVTYWLLSNLSDEAEAPVLYTIVSQRIRSLRIRIEFSPFRIRPAFTKFK